MIMRTQETQLKDELATEHERRVKAELKGDFLVRKIREMEAFQHTVHSFMDNSEKQSLTNNQYTLQHTVSTKNSTVPQEKEPMPSFIKALQHN